MQFQPLLTVSGNPPGLKELVPAPRGRARAHLADMSTKGLGAAPAAPPSPGVGGDPTAAQGHLENRGLLSSSASPGSLSARGSLQSHTKFCVSCACSQGRGPLAVIFPKPSMTRKWLRTKFLRKVTQDNWLTSDRGSYRDTSSAVVGPEAKETASAEYEPSEVRLLCQEPPTPVCRAAL